MWSRKEKYARQELLECMDHNIYNNYILNSSVKTKSASRTKSNNAVLNFKKSSSVLQNDYKYFNN